MKSLLRDRRIFDGRNMYEPDVMRQHGMDYHGIGRMARADERAGAYPAEMGDLLRA
jgi:UDPglucose 6-dehydrogenase